MKNANFQRKLQRMRQYHASKRNSQFDEGVRIFHRYDEFAPDALFAQLLVGYLKASVWEALNATHRQHPEWNRSDMEDFRKAMAARLSSRMRDLHLERNAEFAAAATRQGTGMALVLVADKLAKRDAEFGSPKYKHSRITVRDQMAAHKGSLAGDQVGFAKPIEGGRMNRK